MKQTTKNIPSIITQLLLFTAVVYVVSLIRQPEHPTVAQPRDPIVRTQQATVAQQPSPTATTHSAAPVAVVTTSTSPTYDEIRSSIQQEYVYHMFASPNDPRYASNWTFAKINAPSGWDVSTGNGQTVAVIDSGFALQHEDLADRWAINSGEAGLTQSGGRCWTGTPQSKQSNNCDDDNNGYIDDWRGWSFVNRDNNPQTGRTSANGDGVRHGTEVAGIVGATTNNGTGIASIGWNTKIMPLQALGDDGVGYTSNITAAVYYAVDNGADVINLSLGAYANDPALRTAVTYATAHNVVIVAAAGNCGDGGDECSGVPIGTVAYPAAYADVIAVGATTSSDQRASFSSYGPALDVSAPGYAVPSSTSWSAANQTSLYSGSLYGTSFASPQVASLVSLIKSIRPDSSVGDITAIIDGTASKTAAMNNQFYSTQQGHGVINVGAALNIASALGSASTTPVLMQTGSPIAEHSAPSGITISSGCQIASPCTVQLRSNSGNVRFLPYMTAIDGSSGWTWLSDSLDSDNWEVRARSGEYLSQTPYYLFKQ